ncbi:MAG: protein kinase domain-containing protein [Nocardioides sp.]
MSDPVNAPRSSDLVPGIELGEVIGRGGFATVYRGTQRALGREVAVKIDNRVLDDDRNQRRFVREATAVSRISGHPHVVSLIDVGTTMDNRPYLVMELCAKGSLGQLLSETGPLRVDEARTLGLAMCSALAAAHHAGILHRDIKPANILIDAYGTPRLSDFGLAAIPAPDRELSVTMESLTPAYASPEAFNAAVPTPQGDVWSMGATLHAMISPLSPRRYPDGSPAPVDYIVAHLADEFADPEVPGSATLMRVIGKATAYDPAQRYRSGRELYDALAALELPTGPDARVAGGPHASFTQQLPDRIEAARGPAGAARRRWPGLLAASAAGLLLGGGAVYLSPLPSPPGDSGTPDRSQVARKSGTSPPGPEESDGATAGLTRKAGTCYGGLVNVAGVVTAREVPCDEPHFWEAFAVGVLAEATTAVTDTDVAEDPQVLATCTRKALRSYLSGKRGVYRRDVLPPEQVAFAGGDRGFSCLAATRAGGEVTGRLAEQ